MTKCPDCGAFYVDYGKHFDECPELIRRRRIEATETRQRLIEKFHLRSGPPTEPDRRSALAEAERRLRILLKRDFEYDPEWLFESEAWWYIPYYWVGCDGYIVDKKTGSVGELGSSLSSLDDRFWGHDLNLTAELVDFSFAPDTSVELAKMIFSSFRHMDPNDRDVNPYDPYGRVRYRDSEIESAFERQFPTFERHFVGGAISKIRTAYENQGLRFTAKHPVWALQ
jgi:hypothetical protein